MSTNSVSVDPVRIGELIKNEVRGFHASPNIEEAGRVISVGDGIIRVFGLTDVMSGELLKFSNGETGIAMNLEETSISAVLLGKSAGINEGAFVSRTSRIAHVPVGDAMLGRVVNAIGEPIDQKGALLTTESRQIERVAPGVLTRKSVDTPLLTGIKAIDAMVPIGRGQRQLIVGDRQTGKTAIAIDTIINQRSGNIKCIYVAIGQKNSTVSDVVRMLTDHGAMRYTTVVMAGASEPPSMQYLAPYSGCAIAEYWMEQGQDVLIVYDDLTKHAVAYRTMSLLMKRPPGREAYPGDIFYLHSRLLERAVRMSDKYGGGSITALPIVETQGGDMSAYIPTNVISITDGQIYLETESFNAGIRPAINPGLSVSRVGGAAQSKAMKQLAGPIRMDYAQYRELAAFAQFSSDLDQDTLNRLRHGERIVETFKQAQYSPMLLPHEIIVLIAAGEHFLDDIDISDILDFERRLVQYFAIRHDKIMNKLQATGELSAELKDEIIRDIASFKDGFMKNAKPQQAE